MTDATRKTGRTRQRGITIAGTALYLLTLLLLLYEVDRQHFTNAKRQLIRDNFHEIFALPDVRLRDSARSALFARDPAARQAAVENLQELCREIVAGPTSIFAITLKDADGTIIFREADPSKPRRLNSFDNCLFLPIFDALTDLTVARDTSQTPDARPVVGRLSVAYASPPEFAPLQRLTIRFRWISAGIILVAFGIFVLLYRHLLRPMERVTEFLQRSKSAPPDLIPHAATVLESAYNEIASQALLQQVQDRYSRAARADVPDDRRQLVAESIRMGCESFGARALHLLILRESPDAADIVETVAHPPAEPPATPEILRALSRLRQTGATGTGDASAAFLVDEAEFAYSAPVGGQTLLILGTVDLAAPGLRFRLKCLQQLCETIRSGCLAMIAFESALIRERSEANINLARNLGHDLTNVIATGKLHLSTLRQILGPTADQPILPARRELLRESLDGALESVRYLQEIVNIYRSFSYVKRPQYERCQLNDVLASFLDSFGPTVSARVAIERHFQEGIPAFIMEPRLLRLAMHNLLANAADALKRSPTGPDGAVVRVITRHSPADETCTIIVEDNGPGIRDARGRLLPPRQLESIFRYGYSTKTESSEGLGLHWVRTIIEDFHSGRVLAENVESGGARFTLTLRSMEIAEARLEEPKPASSAPPQR